MLKSLVAAAVATAALVAGAPAAEKRAPAGIPGFDVSNYQGTVNMQTQYNNGARWVYIKATEGTTFTDSYFSSHYNGATSAGLIRGAYHFARPDVSGGAAQATFFVANGGGWSADGITLPGALDIEYGPNGNTCYGLSATSMVSWIKDFSDTYHSKTGRYPTIYSTADWWRTCTGNTNAFSSTNALWVAQYASSVTSIPGGWPYYSFWQYSSSQSPYPGDEDVWNGSLDGLKAYAKGS
ncbi:hypothetical protein OC834_003660 [Tilletia horrida]|uniref:Lysozyme n=1 Tax=Tilletia horrida TaxID=155126 RepID=A0AAN6GDH8_9BASI|nr:hypothetical protein OC834_003660 [Tilletia horrida]KAK0531857.1 hypothetical protein OC835_003539 [Tilletia horrida]KAK0534817.1 hypothetical protein OC842_002530 [Tilletia horrida]KAK0563984.1 hypothetical protein OC844_001936 [Tilletia horrida]